MGVEGAQFRNRSSFASRVGSKTAPPKNKKNEPRGVINYKQVTTTWFVASLRLSAYLCVSALRVLVRRRRAESLVAGGDVAVIAPRQMFEPQIQHGWRLGEKEATLDQRTQGASVNNR
jgi:hypothetical protein